MPSTEILQQKTTFERGATVVRYSLYLCNCIHFCLTEINYNNTFFECNLNVGRFFIQDFIRAQLFITLGHTKRSLV